jgi:hypothetical protein
LKRLKKLKNDRIDTMEKQLKISPNPKQTPQGGSMLHIVAPPTGAIVGKTTERMTRIDKILLAFISTRKE